MSNTASSSALNSKQRSMMIIISDDELIDRIEKTNDPSLLKKLVLETELDKNEKTQNTIVANKSQLIKSAELTCVVCESPAYGYNLGAIVCESCKAFFRRNSKKNSVNTLFFFFLFKIETKYVFRKFCDVVTNVLVKSIRKHVDTVQLVV